MIMKITYIFRAQSNQRSIERVFGPVIEEMIASGNELEVEYAEKGRTLISTLWKNMRLFSVLSKHRLCHITGDVQYVACMMNPDNTLLTIHDLVPFHNKNVPWYSRWLCYWLWYYIPLRRLKIVTCISEATRQDLISYFPWAKDKIIVIPNPVDTHFRFVSKEFNATCPRILHIGTKPNKNLLRVIEALDGIKCQLRIIGRIPEAERLALQEYSIDYSNEEFVSDEQILQEYIDCDIVSFPSLFEGFGMPIIEGQTTGRVVVTSNIDPMRTVAGEGAVFVNPNEVNSIREGFIKAKEIKDIRMIAIEKGLVNAKKYSVQSITASYVNSYNILLHDDK